MVLPRLIGLEQSSIACLPERPLKDLQSVVWGRTIFMSYRRINERTISRPM